MQSFSPCFYYFELLISVYLIELLSIKSGIMTSILFSTFSRIVIRKSTWEFPGKTMLLRVCPPFEVAIMKVFCCYDFTTPWNKMQIAFYWESNRRHQHQYYVYYCFPFQIFFLVVLNSSSVQLSSFQLNSFSLPNAFISTFAIFQSWE